jgi:hypothetical protein
MRKSLALAPLLSLCLLLSGCFYSTDFDVSRKNLTALFDSIEGKDRDALMGLLAPGKVEEMVDLDSRIDGLFSYYKGKHGKIIDAGDMVSDTNIHGKKTKEFQTTVDVETSADVFRCALIWRTRDDFDSGNIGLWSLYIITKEEFPYERAYWGDEKWTPGINIAVQ